MAFIWSLALPAVGTSIYFHSKIIIDKKPSDLESSKMIPMNNEQTKNDQTKFSVKGAVKLLWTHLINSYSDKIIIQWSIWWALAMCGYMQVSSALT